MMRLRLWDGTDLLLKSGKNREYIDCLRQLDEKFPDLNMTKDIDLAVHYMD